MYRLARLWLRCLLAVASIVLAGIISVIFGLGSAPSNIPLVDVLLRYPLLALGVGILLFLVTLGALLVARETASSQSSPSRPEGVPLSRLAITIAISTVSTSLFLALLVLVLARPSWCPAQLCPTSQVLTNPAGIHDSTMELYFTAIQSSAFEIPGNPTSYPSSDLPMNVAAFNIDQHSPTQSPYRVVIGVHSLQTGSFGLVIQEVAIVIRHVPPLPQPLNVWEAGSPFNYQSNIYRAAYLGQRDGSILPAHYMGPPGGFAELKPGEADDLDIQLDSNVSADIQFQIQVTYRVANDSQLHSLTLPRVFEVIFSGHSNWHIYAING